MILMSWVRNGQNGFTAEKIRVDRTQLARFLKRQLTQNLWRIYCHEQTALAIYDGLAAQTADPLRRAVLLRLAERERNQLRRRAGALHRLNAGVPDDCQTVWARAWQRALIWSGPRWALAWIERVKRSDLRCQLELVRFMRGLRGR